MLLIATSRGRDWKTIKESHLYKIFLKSFLLMMDKECKYVVSVGIDKDDPILDNEANQQFFKKYPKRSENGYQNHTYSESPELFAFIALSIVDFSIFLTFFLTKKVIFPI